MTTSSANQPMADQAGQQVTGTKGGHSDQQDDHIDQVRKRAAQRMGMLGPLLNRKSDLSIRNGVLLYKQLIRPMMDYECPA